MDNKTLELIHFDIKTALTELKILALSKAIIADLDKMNRARKLNVYNQLPRIDYKVDDVDILARAAGGHGNARKKIVNIISNLSLNDRI